MAYAYDAAGQILRSGSRTFAYLSGRVISSSDPAGTTTYTYSGTRRSRTVSPSSVATYTWSLGDRLTGVAIGSGGTQRSSTHTYDVTGQRTRSVVASGAVTTTTTFTYDGISLLALSSATGTATTDLTYLRDELDHPRALVVDAPELADPLVLAVTTTMRGDVIGLTDAAGATLATWDYDPYGRPTASSVTTTALVPDLALASRIAKLQVLRYAGYAFDELSGLYYCSQRYYDPATCQFISCDPVGADGEESAYQYCGGDPVGATDPSGLIPNIWSVSSAKTFGSLVRAATKSAQASKAAQKRTALSLYRRKLAAEAKRKAAAARKAAEKARAALAAADRAARSAKAPSWAALAASLDPDEIKTSPGRLPGVVVQDLRGVTIVIPPYDPWKVVAENNASHEAAASANKSGYLNLSGAYGSLTGGVMIERAYPNAAHPYVGGALGKGWPYSATITQCDSPVTHGMNIGYGVAAGVSFAGPILNVDSGPGFPNEWGVGAFGGGVSHVIVF